MGMGLLHSVVATPNHHQTLLPWRPNHHYTNTTSWTWLQQHGQTTTSLIRCPRNDIRHVLSLCSSSQETPLPESSTEDVVALPPGGCRSCGRQEIENGCNGEGRIQGGIATVPGFGWWPIKAYRPCPGFIASGGRYKRQGQSMDEVAFGRSDKVDSK